MQIDTDLTTDTEKASETPSAEASETTPATASADAQPAPDGASPEVPTEPVVEATEEAPAPEPAPEPVAAPESVQISEGNEPPADLPASAVNAPAESAPVETASDADLFEAAMKELEMGDAGQAADTSVKRLSKGDRVEATVIQVEKDRVFVNLGTKSEGIIPLGELTDDANADAHDLVKVGDRIQVIVIRAEGGDGNPIVSKKRADFENAWLDIEEMFNEGTVLNAPVVDRVKGGLVVDIGVRGFVPATHVGNGKLRNIDKFVGQTLPFKILEIDRERKKVVLSNRLAEEEKRASAKDDLFNTVKPGATLEGTVRRLTDYGAFVDLGGVDGLLHISEMSWMRISHPKEMFKEGQKIQVMVLRLDKDTGKISLGHRQVLPDPWKLIKENYKPGQKLTAKIGRIVQSGAFIKLPEGAEAFLPLSEMSVRRLRKPEDAVEVNQDVEVQIIDLKPDERRMVLSMRALGAGAGSGAPSYGGGAPSGPGGYGDDDRKPGKKKKGRGRRDDDDDIGDYMGRRGGFGGSGVTIGERLGMLKGFATKDADEDEPEEEAEHEVEPEAEKEEE